MSSKLKKTTDKTDESSLISATMQVIKKAEEAEQDALSKSVSFLSSDAIRWMNKRKPSASHSTTAHVTPSRALELRQIFKGLDFDNSGSIDIEELQEAVQYIAANDQGDPIFKEPKKLTDFFVSMDTDGNGTVDFNEFLIGMTSTQANLDEGGTEGTAKLQQAFFDFANKHRRQQIIDNINDNTQSDLVKYDDLHSLFRINYFKDEIIDLSVQDKINRAKEEAKKNLKEIKNDRYARQKRAELTRAREASLYFDGVKQANNSNNTGNNNSNHSKAVLHALQRSKIPDAEYVSSKIDEKIRKSFSNFPLHNEHTFTPATVEDGYKLLEQSNSYKNIHDTHKNTASLTRIKNHKLYVINDLKTARSQKSTQPSLPTPKLPPIMARNSVIALLGSSIADF